MQDESKSRGATRRELLGMTVAAGVGLTLAGARRARADDEKAPDTPDPAPKKLDLLILGGTGFLGPAAVNAALARGHSMTLFNRGKTNPHLFPNLEKLRGDRKKGDLDALKGRKWDAVIDTSAYYPRVVREATDILKDNVDFYELISTISVYPGFGRDNHPIDESSPTGTIEDETTEKVTGESYGPLKVLCENAAMAAMPGRVCVPRPGLIVGPRDPTDRFSYWPNRVMRGGEILAPGTGDTPFQVIDVRDLGEWMIHVIEQKVAGVYNAVGFDGEVSLMEFLHGCKCAVNHQCEFTWVGEKFMEENKVSVPFWIPSDKLPYVSPERAIEKGLTFRPIAQTAADTAAWIRDERPKQKPWRGLKAAREKELLGMFHETSKSK